MVSTNPAEDHSGSDRLYDLEHDEANCPRSRDKDNLFRPNLSPLQSGMAANGQGLTKRSLSFTDVIGKKMEKPLFDHDIPGESSIFNIPIG
jgi:hypothetical protein